MLEAAQPSADVQKDQAVARRHVFFIPGYDPIAPRRYRELYRREAAKQGKISDYAVEVSPGDPIDGNYTWEVSTQIAGQGTCARIEFLTWDDLVKGSMNRTILSSYGVLVRTAWTYIASGAFWRLCKLRAAPMLAALYPIIVLLAQLEVALLIGALIAWVAVLLGAPLLLALVPAVAAAVTVLIGFFRVDRYVFAYYLINDYGFTAQHGGRWPEALAARISQFGDRIAAEIARGDADEILIVGHSSGAHLAVSALAEALAKSVPGPATTVSFLTLGQVIPMQSFLPKAQALRRDLQTLAGSDALTWVDVSAPGDGGSFALSDPVAVTGVAPEGAQLLPKVVSAAFTETMDPEEHKATKYRFFRRHIQYLYAFARPNGYDYFGITAGPETLAARFAERPSSPGTIRTPLSGYRDI